MVKKGHPGVSICHKNLFFSWPRFVVVVVVVEDFGSWVSPPSLNCSLAPCPSTLTRLSVSGGVIPAKNPIYGCLGRPERTYSKVANGAIAIGS